MVSEKLSRRDLFIGLRGGAVPLRPPFAQPEETFIGKCSACGNCVTSCPQKILKRGRGGYPQISFAGGHCTFCGKCADSCKDGAFSSIRDAAEAWQVVAVVGSGCLEPKGISCRACEAWCDARAIRFRPAPGGRSDILLDTNLCTGCGACVAPCPQDAITVAKQTSPKEMEVVA